ncbi:MAG: response regulator [Magnetococcales bacterium]|nr:response regulator [Magnetococcales bacterium]
MAETNQSVHVPWYARLGLAGKFTLLFYLVNLFTLGVVGYYGYNSAADALRARTAETVQDTTRQVGQKISYFMEMARNDLNFVTNSASLLRRLYWQDMNDSKKRDQWQVVTQNGWQEFVRNNDYIFKVRFLDSDGQEKMVIRRDPLTREVRILPEHELQDKSTEAYFQKGLVLAGSAYFVAAPDLNREHGQIEQPLVPVVRIARPVIGENKVHYGVTIITLFSDAIFETIRAANKRSEKGVFYLLDSQGEYLFHPDRDKMFGTLLGHGDNFRAHYPGIMEHLREQAEGTLFDQGHIISFQRILPHPGDQDHYWTLVGIMDEAAFLGDLTHFKLVFYSLMLLMLAMVFLASRYYVGGIIHPLRFVTRQLQHLGRGQVAPEAILYRPQDEIRQMLDSTERLMANMEALVNQADAIAHGDFSHDVSLLSDTDRLGQAINHMTAMLRAGRQSSEQQLWLKDGIGRLSQALTGDLTLQTLAEQALALIAHTLNVGRGVFYIYNGQEQVLELTGSFMFTERTHLSNRFRLGEGAVGQAAMERKPILLAMPEWEDAPFIVTGTASQPSRFTCTWPLVRDGQLLGVLELNGFTPLDPLQREFLASATEVVTSFLLMAVQRQRIQDLFTVAENAKRQAQEQASRLELANARLEEQQQQLQQQTEELQQSNTQMEEQQQQLQQQTEELQQSNAQMEEQQQQLHQQSAILQHKNEALLLSQQALDQRARQLEESNRYKSEFLANMSHELRTPLNSIIVLSKMLAANDRPDTDAERIKQALVIHDSGNELLRLIDDLLDLSKIEAGRVDMHWETFSSTELVDEWQELFAASAEEKGLTFTIDDQYHDSLTSDRHKLSQVVRNLLANACKFTRQGRVDLLVQRNPLAPAELLIQVRDTGIGIPADKQRIIFEEFQQVDGSVSRQFGGTGLGLSISWRLMELLGGRIGVESQEGQGSTFTIHLPIQAPLPTPATPAVAQESLHPGVPAQHLADDRASLAKGARPILIIDDDPLFCATVIQINRHLGYQTIAAGSGAEGLELARAFRPLGIILDLELPDRNGMEILNQLKATHELNAIPVYIVTGKEKQVHWQQWGALGLLTKPVSVESLTGVMAAFLRGGNSPARVLMVVGDGTERHAAAERAMPPGVEVVQVTDIAGAVAALAAAQEIPFRVVVSDYRLQDGTTVAALGQQLRPLYPHLPFIVLCDAPLSEEEEMAVRPYTDTIIQHSPQANVRLLADVERFLTGIRPPSALPAQPISIQGQEMRTALAGRTLLVVDDDPRNLYVITAALERHGGRVLQAMNGKKAMELLAKETVDLVIMDIMMPEMNGYQAIEAIRADDRLKTLPIIALTAKAMQKDREKCLAVGANDYLAKPVDYEMLINMVRVWSQQTP